jgi:transposase-like protein
MKANQTHAARRYVQSSKRQQMRGGGGQVSVSGETPAAGGSSDTDSRRKDGTRKIFSAAERAELLAQYAAWKGRQADFCAAHGVSSGSLLNWRTRVAAGGQASLQPLRVRQAAARAAAGAVPKRQPSNLCSGSSSRGPTRA